MHAWLCTTSTQCLGGQKKELDPLEMDLGMVVSHPVGTENGTWVFWENKCSSYPGHGRSSPLNNTVFAESTK